MPGRFAVFTCRLTATTILTGLAVQAWADGGAIVKPRDGSWIRSEKVEIIAKAAGAHLRMDGKPVEATEVFPGVFRATVPVSAGRHFLQLEFAEGSHEVHFHSGPDPPSSNVAQFVHHPPVQTECAHCHTVSRRGRFRFSGGCQTCHGEEQFIHTHSHQPHELASCGMCHDAHGSSVAHHLVLPREQACKQCHN